MPVQASNIVGKVAYLDTLSFGGDYYVQVQIRKPDNTLATVLRGIDNAQDNIIINGLMSAYTTDSTVTLKNVRRGSGPFSFMFTFDDILFGTYQY